MKIAIVVLAIASAAVCAPPGRGYPPCSNGMPPPPPPYLRNVTQEAREEYFEILSRDNETIAQQNQDILTWAQKYGLEAEVQEFRTNSTNRRTIVEQNVTSLIGQLSAVLQQGIAIVNDENQTAMNQTMALRNLSSEYPQAFAVLQFAVSLFLPPGAPQLFGDIQPGVLPSPGGPPIEGGPCGFPPPPGIWEPCAPPVPPGEDDTASFPPSEGWVNCPPPPPPGPWNPCPPPPPPGGWGPCSPPRPPPGGPECPDFPGDGPDIGK